MLSFCAESSCGYRIALQGIEMGYVPHPVHHVHIKSKLITGVFPVAVCPALPIKGVALLMGNDIAGGDVIPALEVLDSTPSVEMGNITDSETNLFPSCVMTRAQARKRDLFFSVGYCAHVHFSR